MHTAPDISPPTARGAGFASLPLTERALANLANLGFLEMTPVQAASLPVALAGGDLIAQAPTGSGKTVAFGLPLLGRVEVSLRQVQALVLCPTRELAEQVAVSLRQLARAQGNVKLLSLCGGTPIRPQRESLAHGAHVVVGTPGRLMDLLEQGALDLGATRTLVLDEADRMLDMGFLEDIASVVRHCPSERQTLLFSATFPEGIEKLASRFLRRPVRVTVREGVAPSASVAPTLAPPSAGTEVLERDTHSTGKVQRWAVEVTEPERLPAVARLLRHFRPESTLAFCNTRQQCRDLVNLLRSEGITALGLHGDLEQRERDQVLIRFAGRAVSVLVATDVAARGIDIAELQAVINVDVTQDVEVQVHREGRTGRAGHGGLALQLVSLDEMARLGRVELAQGRPFDWLKLGDIHVAPGPSLQPRMAMLQMLGGRKEKIRPGDVLGALTGEAGFAAEQVGKIKITDFHTFVALDASIAAQALRKLAEGTVKGRKTKWRILDDGPS